MRTVLTILTVLFVLMVPGLGAQAPPPPQPVLDLRINPLMDLHYWVRKLAREESPLPAVEGLPAAVAATNQAGLSLGDPWLWGILDASFTEAGSAEELAHVATQVPESFKTRDGKSVPVRQSLLGLAAGYQGVEKGFLATVWPGHREVAERAAATVRKVLFPKAAEVYADLSSRLGLPAPGAPIPVYLVAAAPFPGAFTLRSQGRPFSVVALEGEPDSQWVEIVVHESIHALDVLAREGSVLAELQRRLSQVPGADPQEVHDFVHTVMFVQAAGTVRRVLDPGHKDYGDVGDAKGYYARVGRAATVVVPAWRAYLDGKSTRDEAMARIVAGFSEGLSKKEKGDRSVKDQPRWR